MAKKLKGVKKRFWKTRERKQVSNWWQKKLVLCSVGPSCLHLLSPDCFNAQVDGRWNLNEMSILVRKKGIRNKSYAQMVSLDLSMMLQKK